SLWTTKDFPTRLHEALNAATDRKRRRALDGIAEDLDPAQIRDALAEVGKLHIRERNSVIGQLLARWAEIDPLAAMDYANGLSKANERNQAVAAAIGGWAEKDPRAAEEWA